MIVVIMSSTVNFEKSFDLTKNKYSWKNDMIIIAGATCTGKSSIAIGLAKRINGAIINADSVQVYKDINSSWDRLNLNGIIICDDYFYGDINLNTSSDLPANAINQFLFEKKNNIKIVCVNNTQIFIKKISS